MRWSSVMVVILASGCGSPTFEPVCSANGYGASCQFTNIGDGAGSVCVQVTVTGSGRSATSSTICSGEVASRASGEGTASFVGSPPADFCADSNMDGRWDNCTLRIDAVGEVVGSGAARAVPWIIVGAQWLLAAGIGLYLVRKGRSQPGETILAVVFLGILGALLMLPFGTKTKKAVDATPKDTSAGAAG
jgi:hypothetical protein